jgi:hypothetical protein
LRDRDEQDAVDELEHADHRQTPTHAQVENTTTALEVRPSVSFPKKRSNRTQLLLGASTNQPSAASRSSRRSDYMVIVI